MSDINFNDYFYYDETSPSCLRWKVDKRAGKNHNMVMSPKDSCAGGLSGEYYRLCLNYKKLVAHRVVWEILVGSIPEGFDVDHKDQNKLNNKIDNLRLVLEAVNSRNCPMFKNNKSGVTGVCYRGELLGWTQILTEEINLSLVTSMGIPGLLILLVFFVTG